MTSRYFLLFAAFASLVASPLSAEVKVESEDDKAFYLIGLSFGRQLGRLYPSVPVPKPRANTVER